ncbi:heavy metal translocating P-type ATPase [Asticcacaulis taihuensis]|uniref:P-type Zn(2+) transporter n=1 Tax=Asticcacaulis taihuensis TaxID=260084 RepID=A0A1G4PTH7_9CAUL|nr:heavy metal translocating P-type ATPase [Asticcacaulis taihuensis]SCW35547.1 Cd2+/Zn2+-exporting ATPase [Asticcacaulis taihuensis]
MADTIAYRTRVEGMDCASCALKIETALEKVLGVSNIRVNYQTCMLSLDLDETQASQADVETKVTKLGYKPVPVEPKKHGASGHEESAETGPWWKTAKAKLVFYTAVAVGIAFLIGQLFPPSRQWVFVAATLIGGLPIARKAVKGILSGTPFTIETLMTVASVGAICIGKAEEAAVVVFLFAVGELLENVAAASARRGIKSLINLMPKTAFREKDGQISEVPVADLKIGDIAVVRPGDRVPSDGKVVSGASDVNEAPVTGESVPVLKEPGAKVFAGSINANAELRIEIENEAADNTIARIVHMVEEAQESKAPTARLIDRFSLWYTPGAMVVAALVIVIPPLLFGADWMTWIYRGLATLLIACPCALIISTPAAIASGLSAGARQGLLIKGGAALETLGKIKTVAFDKTGTLTIGKPTVTDIIALEGEEDSVLAIAAAVEKTSSHPLAVAIVEAAEARKLDLPASFGGAVAKPGKAVTARLKSGFVSVGSPSFAAEKAPFTPEVQKTIDDLEGQGKTVVVVMTGTGAQGLIAIRDELRDDATTGIQALTALGIQSIMLTGDNERAAKAIAASVGLQARAKLIPEEKLKIIGELKASGPVAMVGDGINDAPALAASSVGIAMGGGTDVAIETAEVALFSNRVGGVADLVYLSKATLGNIWQNIALALGLKAIFLVTTLMGTTTLWMAILADTGATVLVTINALRLLGFRAPSRK